jgi:Flp pilus assembly protein TadD/outer membrane protein OmpA-like peptidoglycan-associated protein
MNRIVKYGILLTACAFTLSSCNCFKKMAKNQDRISVVANPEVLTLVGGNITTEVTVVFPEKYYNPKAVVKVTPMLVFEGGAIEGAPKFFQGEKVKDNYTVISKRSGGVATQSVSFPWDPRARMSTLELKVEGKCKAGDEFTYGGTIAVAEGVNTLQADLAYAGAMTIMPDNFMRVTHESESVDIMYQVNRSNVRPTELSKAQTELFENFIRENQNRDRVTLGNIQAKGYASPEGPEGFNDELSRKRGESGRSAVQKQLAALNLNYDVASYGEDWEGFKALVEASNMRDKNMIIQVLNMYSSAAQRDLEIRNMAAVFEELKQNILPELRRTQMLATTDIQGKTDAELRAAVGNNIGSLNVEETLFAATLFDSCADKARIYKSAADRFNDARAWNNMGIALAGQNDWAGAQSAFQRATTLSSDPAMANNLALVALAQGNTAEAAKYLSTASATTRAMAQVHSGNYAAASTGLEGYNKAVADVLNGNLSAAKNALTGDQSAKADYLRGVISVKEGNNSAAVSSVKAAIGKDSSLRAKALTDINLKAIAGQL